MAVTTLISEQEYLRTSYPDLDREYCDGEVIERSMPDNDHGKLQSDLGYYFGKLRIECGLPLYGCSETRNRTGAARFRIPDISVFWPTEPRQAVPEFKPLIAIEILSPSDSLMDVRVKLREYVDAGIPHVWLLDPRERVFVVFGQQGLREVPVLSIPEVGIEIQPSDFFRD